jgi:hypothetical protein
MEAKLERLVEEVDSFLKSTKGLSGCSGALSLQLIKFGAKIEEGRSLAAQVESDLRG